MNLIPFALIWAVLAFVVLALAGYRQLVAHHEDDTVHLRDTEASMIQQQTSLARRLEWIDRWGKVLTAFTLAMGLVLVGIYLYHGWVESSKLPGY
jgi:hypothetical protein